MERHCRHSNSVFVPACRDAVLLQERVLANLLTAETLYCSTAGTKPRPGLAGAERRRLVTEWMLEVCQVRTVVTTLELQAKVREDFTIREKAYCCLLLVA